MRRSREQWAEIVGEFERGGLSHEAFCAQQRLNIVSGAGFTGCAAARSEARSRVARRGCCQCA